MTGQLGIGNKRDHNKFSKIMENVESVKTSYSYTIVQTSKN